MDIGRPPSAGKDLLDAAQRRRSDGGHDRRRLIEFSRKGGHDGIADKARVLVSAGSKSDGH